MVMFFVGGFLGFVCGCWLGFGLCFFGGILEFGLLFGVWGFCWCCRHDCGHVLLWLCCGRGFSEINGQERPGVQKYMKQLTGKWNSRVYASVL